MKSNEPQTLASELLHEIKAQTKRWFILFIIILITLFVTNLTWLHLWYTERCTMSDTTNTQSNDVSTNININDSDSVTLDAN